MAPVARKYNINLRTGQRWWNKYKEDPDSFFIPKERGIHKILNEEHKKFLINLFDDNPSTVIEQAVDSLTKQFEGLEIAKSTVHNFIKNGMGFTFKKAQFHSLKQNDDEIIEKRY